MTDGAFNTEWADQVLVWWIEKGEEAVVRNEVYGWPGPKMDELWLREHQTRAVMARLLGRAQEPLLTPIGGSSTGILVQPGLDRVKRALGVLRTQEETRANMGSTAPRMAADALHPVIWDAASKLWNDGHHGQAVQRAATFLNAHVQDLVGRHDVSDAGLMLQAFSLNPPEPGRPRLRWPGDDDDLTVKAMRGGILNFAQGCFQAIRNPTTHSTDDLPRQEALEQLATLSTLARWIDGCEVVPADE